jgi:hypothetical protein
MAKIDIMELTETELQKHINTAFLNIVAGMAKEGFITPDQASKLQTEYFVSVESHSWLPKWVIEKMSFPKDRMKYVLAKRVE